MDFKFSSLQMFHFKLLDASAPATTVKGTSDLLAGDLVGSENKCIVADIDGQTGAILAVQAKLPPGDNKSFIFNIAGVNIESWNSKGTGDLYLAFYKKLADKWVTTHQTNVVVDNMNPEWNNEKVTMGRFCGNNPNAPLLIKCFD